MENYMFLWAGIAVSHFAFLSFKFFDKLYKSDENREDRFNQKLKEVDLHLENFKEEMKNEIIKRNIENKNHIDYVTVGVNEQLGKVLAFVSSTSDTNTGRYATYGGLCDKNCEGYSRAIEHERNKCIQEADIRLAKLLADVSRREDDVIPDPDDIIAHIANNIEDNIPDDMPNEVIDNIIENIPNELIENIPENIPINATRLQDIFTRIIDRRNNH